MSIVDNHLEGLEIKEEGSKVSVKYVASTGEKHKAVQGTVPWVIEGATDAIYYYEVAVISAEDAVGVGLAEKEFPVVKHFPGWLPGSFGYHGDDGHRFIDGQNQLGGWPQFGKGAVVGIGLKVSTGEIFGTLDGKLLGRVAAVKSKEPLLATIGFNDSAEVEVFFDKKDHKFDLSSLPEHIVPIFGSLEETDRSSLKVIVLFTNGVEEAQRVALEGQLEAAAKTAHSKYGYQSFFTSKTEKKAENFRSFVGIHDRAPLLVAINLKEDTKYAIPEGESITAESILKLLSDIDAGTLVSLKKSAPRPAGDKHPKCPTLVQVVGSSFDELVLGGAKDVLLDVYADWCGPCRAVAPTLEILSEVFADNDNIVIAKIDCDANDYDRTYLPETSIPNIKLFPGANKKEPIKYQGNRSLENFLEFLHTNATVKFDLEAAKAKAKQLKVQAEKKALKNVVPIHTAEDFKAQIGSGKLVVVDYFATWCGPCKTIAPVYANLSEEFSSVVFLKVDVDELQEVSKEQGIECMPTFKAYKNGAEVGKLEGANSDKLKKLITDNL